jgi:hypothetical protein
MLSALAYAIYIVGVKVSALRELPGAVLTFYALLLCQMPCGYLLYGGILLLEQQSSLWGEGLLHRVPENGVRSRQEQA